MIATPAHLFVRCLLVCFELADYSWIASGVPTSAHSQNHSASS
jgi:hypothetical protein